MGVANITRALPLKLPPTPKLVLFSLANGAGDENRECWNSYRRIAAEASVSRRSAIHWVGRLEDWGYLSVEKRYAATGRQTSNVYVLHVEAWEGIDATQPWLGEGEQAAPGGGAEPAPPEGEASHTLEGETHCTGEGEAYRTGGVKPAAPTGVKPAAPSKEDPKEEPGPEPKEGVLTRAHATPQPTGTVDLSNDAGHIARAPDGTPLVMPCSDGGEAWGVPITHTQAEQWASIAGMTLEAVLGALDSRRRQWLMVPGDRRHSGQVLSTCAWHLTRERNAQNGRRRGGAPRAALPAQAAQPPPPGEDDTTYDPASDEPDDPQPPREAAAG